MDFYTFTEIPDDFLDNSCWERQLAAEEEEYEWNLDNVENEEEKEKENVCYEPIFRKLEREKTPPRKPIKLRRDETPCFKSPNKDLFGICKRDPYLDLSIKTNSKNQQNSFAPGSDEDLLAKLLEILEEDVNYFPGDQYIVPVVDITLSEESSFGPLIPNFPLSEPEQSDEFKKPKPPRFQPFFKLDKNFRRSRMARPTKNNQNIVEPCTTSLKDTPLGKLANRLQNDEKYYDKLVTSANQRQNQKSMMAKPVPREEWSEQMKNGISMVKSAREEVQKAISKNHYEKSLKMKKKQAEMITRTEISEENQENHAQSPQFFTRNQRKALLEYFCQCENPSNENLRIWSTELDVPFKSIKKFFKNSKRRQRNKMGQEVK